jgi:ribonuclease D
MRPLTPDMLAYAAQDTMHLLGLRDELKAKLIKLDRLGWAQEEFERLEAVEFAPDDPANAFLRLKGARDLTRRELALLRELVQWRDAQAAALDRATFRVMGNETLLDIARAAPDSASALMGIKGVPRGLSDSRQADVLAAVQRGLAVPEADLPKFPKAPRWDRDPKFDDRVSALRTVRDEVAGKLELDPGVLCSRERLETIARKVPTTLEELAEVKDLRRWQIGLMGERMLKAVAR